jgi:hypothetical protein
LKVRSAMVFIPQVFWDPTLRGFFSRGLRNWLCQAAGNTF